MDCPMKRWLIAASVFILVAQVTNRQVIASEGFEDLVRVVKSGADDKALAAYIDASPVAYALTVDEILFLNDLGLSSEMINAMIEHGKKLAGSTSTGGPPAVDLGGTLAQQEPTIDQAKPVTTLVEVPAPAPEPPPQEPPGEDEWSPAAVISPGQDVVQ